MNLDENRIGRFSISLEWIRCRPDDVLPILSKCLVVRAEMLMHRAAIEYIAYSDDFDSSPFGEEPPTYKPIMREDVDPETRAVTVTMVGLEREGKS